MFKKFGIFGLAFAAVTLLHPVKASAQEYRRDGGYVQSYGSGPYAHGYREHGDDGWREDRREDRRRDREWRKHERREHEWREHERREHDRDYRYYRQSYHAPAAGVYFSWGSR
jgi:hypothetical protein